MSEQLALDQTSGLLKSVSLPVWAAALSALLLLLLAAAGIILLVMLRRARRKAAAKSVPDRVSGYAVGKLHSQGAREAQQDCFAVSDQTLIPRRGLLAVVADGMGGLADGDRASAAAVQAALDAFAAGAGGEDPEAALLAIARQTVRQVNEQLGSEGLRKSGSTLAIALLREDKLYFLTVGDSRICLYRQGVLYQLNREHVYRRELALRAVNGEMPLEAALNDEKGGALTSFVGMGALKGIDMPAAPLTLFPGDRVILMSDGVYNALSEQELSGALESEPEEAARALEVAVKEKGFADQDNFTAVVLGCRGER